MKKYNPLLKYAGAAAAAVYVIFTFVSHLFNTAINPLVNWLSDYGNPNLNPSGALFYNLGCILTASLLVLFYTGISQWYRRGAAPRKFMFSYLFARISGYVASACLIVASVFPLGTNTGVHSFFAKYNMIGIDCFMGFMAVAFFMHPTGKKGLAMLGIAAAAFNIITTNAFTDLYIAEWIYFALFIIYASIITAQYEKIAGIPQLRAQTA